MIVNSAIAKILYNKNINVDSEWAYSEALQDIKLNERDLKEVAFKKGDVNITRDWGHNAENWKEVNSCENRYFYYSAPCMFDVILLLIKNNINLCVIYVNDKLTWQVIDMETNTVYQNVNSKHSRKYITYDTIEELIDYESELQDGLFKAVEILIEKLSNKN